MANQKNQHFVPQSYIRLFSDSNESKPRSVAIWLGKQNVLIPNASIADQCSKAYFYGKDMKIENWFKFPEGFIRGLVEELNLTKNISKISEQKLKFFWLVQHLRSEKSLKTHLQFQTRLREVFASDQSIAGRLEEILGPAMTIPDLMQSSLSEGKFYSDTIADLKPVLLVNETSYPFITTDNPAIHYNRFVVQRHKGIRNWGISSAGTYLYLPLSKNLAFIAYDKDVYQMKGRQKTLLSVTENEVRRLNEMLYLHSDDVVFIPSKGKVEEPLEHLLAVQHLKPDSLGRVNFALEVEGPFQKGGKSFLTATPDEFANSRGGGLIHYESTPPIVENFFGPLSFKQKPRFTLDGNGQTMTRLGCHR
jgi:hypothetical protein